MRVPINRYCPDHRTTWIRASKECVRDLLTSVCDKAISVGSYETAVRPFFIVGCGHSGTTLVASRVGRSESVFLVPYETYAFVPPISLAASRKVAEAWIQFANMTGKSAFVEKTPKHVHCLGRISRVFPNAKFIGITRNSLDNCASLYSRFGSLEMAIDRWNLDNAELLKYADKANVRIIKLEDLVADPIFILREVFLFFGISWSDEINGSENCAYSMIGERNPNQSVRYKQIADPIIDKTGLHREILGEKQIDQILKMTKEISRRLGY